jgi:hypothetical protein
MQTISHSEAEKRLNNTNPFDPTSGECRLFICNRPKCVETGCFERGTMGQYSIGPEKDPITMKFCSTKCWIMLKWSMMEFYNKSAHAFPPKNYPIEIKNASIAWIRKGYMDDALAAWKIAEREREQVEHDKLIAEDAEDDE